jgi:hypothetical protein
MPSDDVSTIRSINPADDLHGFHGCVGFVKRGGELLHLPLVDHRKVGM